VKYSRKPPTPATAERYASATSADGVHVAAANDWPGTTSTAAWRTTAPTAIIHACVARNGIDGDRLWVTTAATANTSADASTSDDTPRTLSVMFAGSGSAMTTTPTNPSATPSAVAAVNLVGGDETRERGRHDGDETQQNGGDAARDVPLAGERETRDGLR